jgi:malate dehydrogenase
MVPLTGRSNIAGIPLRDYLPVDKLEAIVNRTRKGGGEIVSLLKTGSAYYAPAAAVAQMAEAILKDKHLIIPASAYLQGEYGLKDLFFGVPVQLGRNGLEKVVEYNLEADEMAALQKSAAAVMESITVLNSLVKI